MVVPGECSSGDQDRARDILKAMDMGFPKMGDKRELLSAYDKASREYHQAKSLAYQIAILSRMVRHGGRDNGVKCFRRLQRPLFREFKRSLTGAMWIELFDKRPHVLFNEDESFKSLARKFTRKIMENVMLVLWDLDREGDACVLSMAETLSESDFGYYLLDTSVIDRAVKTVLSDTAGLPDTNDRRSKGRLWASLRKDVLAHRDAVRDAVKPVADLVGIDRVSGISPFLMLQANQWVTDHLIPLITKQLVHPLYCGKELLSLIEHIGRLTQERNQIFRNGLFWQAVIKAMACHCLEGDFHHETSYRLLVSSVCRPGKVKPMKDVDNRFRKLQGCLHKYVCPLFDGNRDLPVPNPSDLAEMEPKQALVVVAGFMGQALTSKEAFDRLATMPGKTAKLCKIVIGNDATPLLSSMCKSLVEPDIPDICYADFLDQEILAMERAEKERWERDMAEMAGQAEKKEEPGKGMGMPEEKDVSTPYTWELVKDAWADNPKTMVIGREKVAVTADDMQAALHTMKKDVQIKASSVSNAIRHFIRETESDVSTNETVMVNGIKWEKVKRGRVRLLCRMDEDKVLVDVFPRAKWEPGMYE